MLEYRRDKERTQVRADRLEQDQRSSLARLSQLEECWRQVGWLAETPAHGADIFDLRQLTSELKATLGEQQEISSNGYLGESA